MADIEYDMRDILQVLYDQLWANRLTNEIFIIGRSSASMVSPLILSISAHVNILGEHSLYSLYQVLLTNN